MAVKTVAVVGPGRMGIGIATAVLMVGQGYRVVLVDVKERGEEGEGASLERARAEIAANLGLLGELGALEGNPADLLSDLSLVHGLRGDLGACELLFEALPERLEAKRPFYSEVGRFVGDDAVLASATSTFDLRVFEEIHPRAERVVIAHWLNPAFLIPLVEVAAGARTAPAARQRAADFLRAIGKIPVTLRSSPGFIVPRIQVAAMNEALRILEEGVATAEEIDTAIKAGFGFRLAVLGLVEFIDLGGVDILAHAGTYLHAALHQDHLRPPRLVAEKMARGEVGPRSGQGFYSYDGVDLPALFRSRYQGFLELLRLYDASRVLRFTGGIERS